MRSLSYGLCLGLSIPLVSYTLLKPSWSQLSPLWFNPSICLPEGRTLTDVVSAQIMPGTADDVERITVGQRLRRLSARCQGQTLVDGQGREIQFFQLEGCWGNPPINAQKMMQQQAETLRQLRATYTVIEMTCNPTGIPYP